MAMATATAMVPAPEKVRWPALATARCERGRPLPRLVRLLLIPSLLAGAPVSAAKWNIVPTLSVDETYTDNLRLGSAGAARSDWVTQIKPAIAINASGSRLRINAAYSPQFLYRANEGGSDVVHALNAGADAELAPRLAFLEARATISQQDVSLLGPQSDSNVNVTGNRATVRTFSASPYLRHDFAQDARAEARLTFSTVGSDAASNSASDSRSSRLGLRLTSGPAFKLLTWNLGYEQESIVQAQGPRTDTEKLTMGAGRLITPNLRLLGNIGYENFDYPVAGAPSGGARWNLGAEWTPTPRTRLAATTGRRNTDPSYSLAFSHRTRLTIWSADYSEDLTTSRTQALIPTEVNTATLLDGLFLTSFPDPVARQKAVQDFIVQRGLPQTQTVPLNFITSVPYLSKRGQASFGIQGVRNTILANAFVQTREATSTIAPGAGDFATSPRTLQTGASALWTLRMTATTTTNLSAAITQNEFPGTGRRDAQKQIRFGVTRQFLPKLSGSLSYRWLQSDSTQALAGYKENAVTAALLMRF